MRSMGVFSMFERNVEPEEDCVTEKRYQGITENAVEGTCENLGRLWPFGAEGVEQDHTLKKLRFGDDGYAMHHQKDSPASLFGPNSIIGRSYSIFTAKDNVSSVDACCTIKEMTDGQEFWAAHKVLREQGEEIREARQSDRRQSTDGSNMFD